MMRGTAETTPTGRPRCGGRPGLWRRIALCLAGVTLAVTAGCAPAVPGEEEAPVSSSSPSSDDAAPSANPDEPQPAWSEEFDGDLSRWRFSTGAGGWGVNSLVYYTDRETNASVSDGVLEIVAREEQGTDADGNTADFTSARIVSLDSFLYGRFEARIDAPSGGGLWSAFWLLGVYDDETTWPNVGEIDVVELVREGDVLHQTVWGNWSDSDDPWSLKLETPAEESWTGGWHVFAAEWSPEEVVFFVDGVETGRVAPSDMQDGWEWAMTRPVNVVLNLAVGGDWPGPPNVDTSFPAELRVDWVRVYDTTVSE